MSIHSKQSWRMPDCVVIAIRLIQSFQFIAIAAFVAIAAIQLAVVAHLWVLGDI